ncbi:MAG: uroporphyrinogen decarboxylase family protein [Blautia sp.]|uniref:uroporphyrinogen decarboxylase family protein n=1 Tax=Blautia sp. TaxID=1955243 RepID=UPI002E79B75E|nr:uroporphyrinogen decarboxylase family protein [Blautia sp.]MEE1442924.1 uroporphyrinogen decarboxylase family protein [Blautia sp.]
MGNQTETSLTKGQKLFQERLNRVETAIHLGEPDKVPVFTFFSSYIQRAYGSNYANIFYDFEAAGEAAVKFHQDHPQLDIALTPQFTSGKANEIAGSTMIDWPGRPGTKVSPFSSHQVIERELMMQEEYPEMLNDFSGFMIRKYVPRAYSNLKGMADLNLTPTIVLSTGMLSPYYSPEAQDTFQKLAQIGAEDAKAAAATAKYNNILADMGFPPMMTGASEAPYDILGDYFRGTMGIFEDMIDPDMEDYVEQACYMFAEQQIQSLQYFRFVDMPVKRVFFPLHKAMDGFMSDAQYERFYWKPLKKIILALIDMGVTPYIYTEGPYRTRLHHLADVPKGKVFYHFEDVDMAEAKRVLGNTAAICGNLSISRMEFGKKEDIAEDVKRLLDVCAPGGGYLFDFNGSLENCKPENMEIMFETLDKYGKY